MRSFCWVCASLWLFACKPADEVTTATLTLRTLPSCEPPQASAMRFRVHASGDFPSQSVAYGAPLDLPPSTRWLRVELAAKAGSSPALAAGLAALSGSEVARELLLLPLDIRRSCPFFDPLSAAAPGAALAPLADGGLLLAGGVGPNGAASSRVLLLPAGGSLAADVPGGMFERRAGASATAVGTRVVVAGGGPDDHSTADETFEIYDSASGRFGSIDVHDNKLFFGPRRDHGAVGLGDGRVLIAGGRTAGAADSAAEALASAELIDPVAVRASKIEGALAQARVAPSLVALDSGKVLVALGSDANGAVLPAPPLELLNQARSGFDVVATLPSHASAAVAALAGDRLAYVGCDGDEHGCQFVLFAFDATSPAEPSPVELPDDLDLSGVGRLEQVRLLALHDGRLLLTGRDPSAVGPLARQAFLLDLMASRVSARCDEAVEPERACVDLSRVPSQLFELADGSVVELDGEGASLRRADVESELDDAPATLIGRDQLAVLLDANRRFLHDGKNLQAIDANARFDLPHLRFADVRIELALDGDASLLFVRDGAPPIALEFSGAEVVLGTCRMARPATPSLVVERRGSTLALAAGGSCDDPRLRDRIGIGMRLGARASVSALHLTRL